MARSPSQDQFMKPADLKKLENDFQRTYKLNPQQMEIEGNVDAIQFNPQDSIPNPYKNVDVNPYADVKLQETANFKKDYFESDLNQVIVKSKKKDANKIEPPSYFENDSLANQVIKFHSPSKTDKVKDLNLKK